MPDIVKIKHCGTAVEGQMLVNRLSYAGVAAYVQETVPEVRSQIFSGSMNTLLGVDIYVGTGDQNRAKELLEQWEGIVLDEEMIAKEAEAAEIAEDVRDYLEEQETSHGSGIMQRLLWGGNKKRQMRIVAIVMIVIFGGILLFGILT